MIRTTTVKTLSLIPFLWLASAGHVTAQPTGFPAGSHAAGRFTVTAVAALAAHHSDPFAFRLPAYMIRAAYGLTRWFDLALVAGAADLRATQLEQNRTWWSAGYKPLAGFGVWLDPLRAGPLAVFATGTLLTYSSSGASYKEDLTAGQRRVSWDAFDQRFLEAFSAGGISWKLGSTRLYAGAGIGRVWRRVETTQEVHRGTRKTVLAQSTKTYQGEPTVYPLVGFQLNLPHRFFLSVEASGRSSEDSWLAVGFGQTGSPD